MPATIKSHVINARWIVPIVPQGKVLENHSILLEDGVIKDILPTKNLNGGYGQMEMTNLPDHLLTAGFVNAHIHSAMSLFRGYADDLSLSEWLNHHIWPAEAKFVNQRFVRDGTTLAVAEMIASGTTCAADTYFFPEVSAKVFEENYFRAQVGIPVLQFSNAWAKSEKEHIIKGLQFYENIRGNSLISAAFSPHAPYTVTDLGFQQVFEQATNLGIPIHLHLHETKQEVETGLIEDGRRPYTRMRELGLLNADLQTVHMTELNDEEIESLYENQIHVVHCPESNMKLASGICPVNKLIENGVNVALGTDGAASNNDLDLLAEARSAAFLSKVTSGCPSSVKAEEALSMATINGARLLGLDERIGSLEIGKCADIIAFDLSGISFQPIYKPISQLIYAANGQDVTHTWINGECLYKDKKFTKLNLFQLKGRVESWQKKLGGHE